MKFFFFSFETSYNFSIEVKNVAKNVYFQKKRHYNTPLFENKTFFVIFFCRFVDSVFVKIHHEQVNYVVKVPR